MNNVIELQINEDEIFSPLNNKWVELTPEEKLKQEFIIRLLNDYGYSIDQMKQDFEIKKGLSVDIAIWKNSEDAKKNNRPSIIIATDCKAEYVSINKSEINEKYKLASVVNSDFFIVVNLKETKVFRIIKDKKNKEYEDLKNLPKANQILNAESIKKYIEETKAFSKEDFTKLLNKCHNIIRNNDKLSPEAAFDEISKILFMKIMYERNPDKDLLFTWDTFLIKEKYYNEKIFPSLKEQNPNFNKDFIQYEFDDTKRKVKDHKLFEDNDIIKIKRNSFELIVKELELYNLSITSDDIKGIAFEEFLGSTFRGELGQFFTPRTVVDFMVKVIDPQEDEVICDPCCGSGGFLIKTFDYIRDKIEKDINSKQKELDKNNSLDKKSKEKLLESIHSELNINIENSRLRNLSHNCIYGVDANPRMARTAKMNMIMHGDGHGGVHHNDGLLDVNGIFENRFDIILTNPPFGSRVDKSQLITELDLPNEDNQNFYIEKYKDYDYEINVLDRLKSWASKENKKQNRKGTPLLETFETGKFSSLTEVLFIERCLRLLKAGGRMGIVLPEGVLNGQNLNKIRQIFECQAKIILVTSIPQDVFMKSGATVKPSIMFFKKFTEDECKLWQKYEEDSYKELNKKYEKELKKIEVQLNVKGDKALDTVLKQQLRVKRKNIQEKIEIEVRQSVKEKFDYDVPFANVEKAGINSRGGIIENELEDVEKLYSEYRKKNNLWQIKSPIFTYQLDLKSNKVVTKKTIQYS